MVGIESLRLLSISHRSAALADLERMALPATIQTKLCGTMRELELRAVVLCTCNRTELYWCSRGPESDASAQAALMACASLQVVPPPESFTQRTGLAVAAHLFRVAAGLESLVVGEAEILGQVREAIEAAEGEAGAGPFLADLFRAALRCGGRVRSETQIGTGALSVASAAVQLLARVHQDFANLTVVVIGAGVTGLKVARHLNAMRVGRLVIVNRTLPRAEEAAAEFSATAARLEDLPHWMAHAHAMIAAAQVERPVVTPEMLSGVRSGNRERPLLLIDLSLPRAIDSSCAAVPGVALHDLSGLEQVVEHNRARRECEVPHVEKVIEHELGIFQRQVRESMARPLVAELRRRADAIRREEIARTLREGEFDAPTLDHLTQRLVDRLLHAPSLALRSGELALGPPQTRYVRLLFGLEDDEAGAG